jgi:hypothetical protein
VSTLLPDLMHHAERLLKTKYLVKVPTREEVALQSAKPANGLDAKVRQPPVAAASQPVARVLTLARHAHTHTHTHTTHRRAC